MPVSVIVTRRFADSRSLWESHGTKVVQWEQLHKNYWCVGSRVAVGVKGRTLDKV